MPLSHFHPVIARWFADRLGEPTAAQSRGWEAIRSGQDTLIAAPTGSGKTLAAFLIALDQLLGEGLDDTLPDETRIIYVSPLKALSADIHRNLAEPRREIRRLAEELGLPPVRITAAVRTGDTPASERAAMLKTPPHILVTTPESLYLLLTAARSREMLRTARTVIVDEIHAVIGSRRGAHLALSLERLDHVAGHRLNRIGLSATQKPIDEVGRFLVGQAGAAPTIIDEGHRRALDLAIELPGSPLEAVMAGEVFLEVYDRLARLIQEHRTTLIFVNTRRLAERVARHLAERVGEEAVTAHHGSLARDVRLEAEERLKAGRLKALVATASLELGIDIGHVDLACQIGSPHRISTFLQRVGRSGHTVRGTPKGRLFPLTRDDLAECTALIHAVRRGELDRLHVLPRPLDVLAQQIVAEAASEDWSTDALFELVRRAYSYRDLERDEFDEVVRMVAEGFSTRRGRRGALVHYDAVNQRIRGRRGARLLAITSGGAIPDNADYRVVLEPEGMLVGTLNEDFAIESMAGDIFQLGNSSWKILRVQSGVVRVEDARGQPPTIPFWLGEAPARSDELSAEIASIRERLEPRLADKEQAAAWLAAEAGTGPAESVQLVEYLAEARRLLGALPTQDTLIAERFFDEAGGMQLVIHSPFGSRVNRAWGLALRKRFCRSFNFELQAAATEDALLLSLGPQHSFPLEDVFRFLHPSSVRDILIQAMLDAPMFGTHWRWNASIALALPRSRGGRKVPPPIQRMESDDLLAAVFPDAAACLENIPGDREIPEHPLVRQTIDDCLHDIMDIDRLEEILRRIHSGQVRLIARDLPEPSPLAHEILNAKPYAFLDDAPLEERRTQAVYTRRAMDPTSSGDLGALDPAAIDRVRDEAWPEIQNADELHDALLTSGFLTHQEGVQGRDGASWLGFWEELAAAGRAGRFDRSASPDPSGEGIWFATERGREIRAALAGEASEPEGGTVPAAPAREEAIRELLRGRLEIVGPTTAGSLARSLGVEEADAVAALAGLEGEGVVLRGRFTAGAETEEPENRPLEWCERRLLARIHRYTLNRLRAEIEPVTSADFMRFLFAWQRLIPEHRVAGVEGLASVVGQLDGFELAAAVWETDVLAARCEQYDPAFLDTLCLMGRVVWGRLSESNAGRPIRSTPIALLLRENLEDWLAHRPERTTGQLSSYADAVLAVLRHRGASFFPELVSGSKLLATQVEQALGELAAAGLVTADSFAGLRALITPSGKRKPLGPARHRRHRGVPFGIESAGRWSLLPERTGPAEGGDNIVRLAWTLLRRYGVVFKRLLAREANPVPWRELVRVYRRLEARGEIRGGRLVAGMSGEQFALPEAVGQLRATRRSERTGQLIGISAADPLNLVGIVTPGERIAALGQNRIAFEEGVPLAVLEGGKVRWLAAVDPERRLEVERVLVRKRVSPALRTLVGQAG